MSVFKMLEDIANSFNNSRPIYVGRIVDGRVIFELKEVYRPVHSMHDPVYHLMAESFSETLDKPQKKFKTNMNLRGIYERMVDEILQFYYMHSQTKKPKQSMLYKWIKTVKDNINDPAAEGMVALFRYIFNNDGANCNDKTSQNVMAILELMKEKYDTKKNVNER